jgi:hypothetical protein
VHRDGPTKLYSKFKRRICELQESSIRLISATEGLVSARTGVSAARNLQLQEILAVPLISGKRQREDQAEKSRQVSFHSVTSHATILAVICNFLNHVKLCHDESFGEWHANNTESQL